MFEHIMNSRDSDIFDPYNMLPVEKIVAYLGERR
jgi:hypothetical protein